MADNNFANQLRGYDIQGIPTHEEYQNYIRRWEFLIRSYLGGAQYKLGHYLTKYVLESKGEYQQRLASTPLDNHCKSIIHIYNSFLFRNEPDRDFGTMAGMPELEAFLYDADLEGRSWDSFMKDVNIMSSVYGHCLVLVDKPETNAGTRAEELAQGLRPYANIYTPENILDWQFTRLENGAYELTYLKLFEKDARAYNQPSQYYVRTWTKDSVILEEYSINELEKLRLISESPNLLGKVPAVFVYAQRSPTKGIGVSDIGDVADMQNAIYNELSEIEQLIRISNHPTLVKTIETEASAGAGAIINMPNDTDPGLRPQLLQPSGQSLEGILNSIQNKVEAIDRMGHLGSMRAIEQRAQSGISLQTEMLQFDTKLNEKARSLELAEEQIFDLFALWQGMVFDGEIEYPTVFQVRDKNHEIDLLKKAADTNPADPRVKRAIDMKILEMLDMSEDDLEELDSPEEQSQIQEQLMTGDSNEEIIEDNPGTTVTDIEAAAAAAARDN
jgi:hypothetical protein